MSVWLLTEEHLPTVVYSQKKASGFINYDVPPTTVITLAKFVKHTFYYPSNIWTNEYTILPMFHTLD